MELKYKTKDGLKVISRKTLKMIAPESIDEIDEEDLESIWIMTTRPKKISDEKWTETNEPELGEMISESWDTLAVKINNLEIVVLCGSLDDEYGYYWDNKTKEWLSYAF